MTYLLLGSRRQLTTHNYNTTSFTIRFTVSLFRMAASLPPLEAAKRLAAYAAVDRHIGLNDKVSVEDTRGCETGMWGGGGGGYSPKGAEGRVGIQYRRLNWIHRDNSQSGSTDTAAHRYRLWLDCSLCRRAYPAAGRQGQRGPHLPSHRCV